MQTFILPLWHGLLFCVRCFQVLPLSWGPGLIATRGTNIGVLLPLGKWHRTCHVSWTCHGQLMWGWNGIPPLQFLVWFWTPRPPLSYTTSYTTSLRPGRPGGLGLGLQVDGFQRGDLKTWRHSTGTLKADPGKRGLGPGHQFLSAVGT